MQMMSLTFVYLFLPAALAVYYIVPRAGRNAVLALISAAFFALAQPGSFWLFAGSVALHFTLSEAMRRAEGRQKLRRALMVFGVLENVGVILWFSVRCQLDGTQMPLGTMVVSVTALGYIVDVYKHDAEYERNFIDYALFATFFPKLYTGPLVRIDQMRDDIRGRRFSLDVMSDGFVLFIRGLAKYVLLATPLEEMYDGLKAAGENELSVLGAWMITVTLAMTLFFKLSGFCDMARGVGLLFGLELPKNFYFPFQSPCVTDFLDRFNMTVTQFFRHYVYDNLQTKRSTALQFTLNTVLICMLCGLWFGVKLSYIFWGLYIAAFIVLEKLWLGERLQRIPALFRRVYTFCVTMVSMVIFSGDSLTQISQYFKAMVGAGVPFYTSEVAYILSGNYIALVAGVLLSTSTLSMAADYVRRRRPGLMDAVSLVGSLAMLALTTAFMIK